MSSTECRTISTMVKDLGLIRLDTDNKAVVSGNPIYGEVIIRTLTYNQQMTLQSDERFSDYDMPKYYKNGSVDMNLLLQDFQQFWRENSDIWQERYQYREAAAMCSAKWQREKTV